MSHRSIIPPGRERLAELIGRRNLGLLTPGQESELRDLVAREGYPSAQREDLEMVVNLGYGLMLADIMLGEA